MKRYIIKTSLFLLPVLLLHLFMFAFYSKTGDLLKLGYFMDLYSDYKKPFLKEFANPIHYKSLSQNPPKQKFTLLTLGDSFSEQGGMGYKNYLADMYVTSAESTQVKQEKISVLHIDRVASKNQIETLYAMLKGDFFEHYPVKNVVLQNIERDMSINAKFADTNKVLQLTDLVERAKGTYKGRPNTRPEFPASTPFEFVYNTVQYFKNDTYLFEDDVYKTKLSADLFTAGNRDLLFFQRDILLMKDNNIEKNVVRLNTLLNKIDALAKQKGIHLIVLAAPDKFDLYYNFVVDKNAFPKPMFFEYLNKLPKSYTYLDGKSILSAHLLTQKDIYFYDDTHWSPWASKIVAAAIAKELM